MYKYKSSINRHLKRSVMCIHRLVMKEKEMKSSVKYPVLSVSWSWKMKQTRYGRQDGLYKDI